MQPFSPRVPKPSETAGAGLEPVAVTRWTAQLADPACEHDYRLHRFPEYRRRAVMLMILGSVAGCLNFAVELYAYSRGNAVFAALVPPLVGVWLPLVILSLILRLRSPAMLECVMIAAAGIGMTTRLSMVALHPDLTYMWPTMMVGLVLVIYLYLPIRLINAMAAAAVVSAVAPFCWTHTLGDALPPDQFYRGLVWVSLANALGFIAANSLHRSQRLQFAQSLVLTRLLSVDAMTGIANRRRFDETLQREWRRCARTGAPVSLLMLDVDYFKAYNDHYGHQQGDDCLRRVAQILFETAGRPGDLVARYGGEEFVCLLPEIDEAGAVAVADKLAAAIRQARIAHPRSPLRPLVTVSIGAATARDLSARPEQLVACADQLLYAAKRGGRDQVKAGHLPRSPFRDARAVIDDAKTAMGEAAFDDAAAAA
jgi:diguanylate cyclase (GGDEF)-like protein